MRQKLVHLLVERNPFYLLSALSMLLGCYALNHALALRPGQTGKLLVLLITLNVYEGLLIGLGLFLIQRRGALRDGRILLLLEVFFLADATLLSGEPFAGDIGTGLWISLGALLLALGKVGMVLRVLEPPALRRFLTPLLPPLVLLFGLPGAFALLARWHALTPPTVYAAWWVVGLLIVVQALLESRVTEAPVVPAVASFRRAVLIGGPASLMVHLIGTAWVYHVDLHVAFFGPVLLALGIVPGLLARHWPPVSWSLRLPLVAVVLSLGASHDLTVHGPLGIPISPLRAALWGAGLAYILGYRLHRLTAFAWCAGACVLGAGAGHDVAAMAESVGWLWNGAGGQGRKIVPRTVEGWGVTAIVMAFVLLGLGAAASLLRKQPPDPAG